MMISEGEEILEPATHLNILIKDLKNEAKRYEEMAMKEMEKSHRKGDTAIFTKPEDHLRNIARYQTKSRDIQAITKKIEIAMYLDKYNPTHPLTEVNICHDGCKKECQINGR